MAKVSIIVPVYGEKKWLVECLNSIKASCSFELIVESDPEGTGAANARNRALKRAVGEYVMFCDSDDYLEPGAIDLMLSEMDGVDLVCGSFRKFGDFEITVSSPTQTLGMQEIADYALANLKTPSENQMLSGCWAKLYKRELITNFPNLVTAEDMGFNFDYLRRCKRVRFLENVVYHNRKRQGSLSTQFNLEQKDRLFGLLDGLKYVKSFLEERWINKDEMENALDSSKVYHSMLYFTRIHGGGRETFKRIYP
jgi:glycosyltransferase involved in cell wall biosynthesis